jgi:protein-S-isoprenylcysteine O-methyltransferase Ste14
MLYAILLLPGVVLVVIPAIILWLTCDSRNACRVSGPMEYQFWLALCLLVAGLGLGIWTARLFFLKGQGTPAPWNPPRKLVVLGPYRYVRNPMIISVLISLTAEAIFFQSRPLLAWMVFFFIGNAIYFPLWEEKVLVKRFGEPYRQYRCNVPRWIPRLTPWVPDR